MTVLEKLSRKMLADLNALVAKEGVCDRIAILESYPDEFDNGRPGLLICLIKNDKPIGALGLLSLESLSQIKQSIEKTIDRIYREREKNGNPSKERAH